MSWLFAVIVCFVLLIFLREANEKLSMILGVLILFILFHTLLMNLVIPFLKTVHSLFSTIPYIGILLSSIFLLMIGEFCMKLFQQYDYALLIVFVELIIGVTLATMWLQELTPFIRSFEKLLQTSFNK